MARRVEPRTQAIERWRRRASETPQRGNRRTRGGNARYRRRIGSPRGGSAIPAYGRASPAYGIESPWGAHASGLAQKLSILSKFLCKSSHNSCFLCRLSSYFQAFLISTYGKQGHAERSDRRHNRKHLWYRRYRRPGRPGWTRWYRRYRRPGWTRWPHPPRWNGHNGRFCDYRHHHEGR